jgi:hypothetical protein
MIFALILAKKYIKKNNEALGKTKLSSYKSVEFTFFTAEYLIH